MKWISVAWLALTTVFMTIAQATTPVPLSSLSPAVPGLRLRRIESLLRWLHPAVRIVRRRRAQRLPKRPPKRRLHLPRQPARRAAADRLPAARVVVARWIRSGSAFSEPLPQPGWAPPQKPRFLPAETKPRLRAASVPA